MPHEKFVVVKNPWGLPEKIDGGTKLNEIGAWFALLMRKDYPNSRVREIYYQKTVTHSSLDTTLDLNFLHH